MSSKQQGMGIGAKMRQKGTEGLGLLGVVMGILVYLGAIGYAEARNFSLFTRTISMDSMLFLFAIIGIVALGVTAVALPLVLIFHAAPGKQKWAAVAFYVVDLVVMGVNAVLDAAMHGTSSINEVDPILQIWFVYVFPALPMLVGAGWAVIFHLDPRVKQREATLALKMAAMEAIREQLAEHADNPAIAAQVTAGSRQLVASVISDVLADVLDGHRPLIVDNGPQPPKSLPGPLQEHPKPLPQPQKQNPPQQPGRGQQKPNQPKAAAIFANEAGGRPDLEDPNP